MNQPLDVASVAGTSLPGPLSGQRQQGLPNRFERIHGGLEKTNVDGHSQIETNFFHRLIVKAYGRMGLLN